MKTYHICQFCNDYFEIDKLDEHQKKEHLNETSEEWSEEHLIRIWKEARDISEADYLVLFNIARIAFWDLEKVDIPKNSFRYDFQEKELLKRTIWETHSQHPTLMSCVGNVKTGFKIIVHQNTIKNLISYWQKRKVNPIVITFNIIYPFLHEMYHFIGYGEKDACIKGCNAIFKMFGYRITLYDQTLESWKQSEKFRSKI